MRVLALSMYLPTLLAEIGIGATLPIFALSALSLGEPAAVASIAVAVYSAGRMAGSALGGWASTRWGPIPATFGTYGVLAAGAAVCASAGQIAVLAVGVAVIGVGHGGVHVARQAHVDAVAPLATRGRSLTTLAGTWRIGNFVGPFAGAAIIHAWGLPATYLFAAAMVVLGIGTLVFTAPRHLSVPRAQRQRVRVGEVLKPQMRVLTTLGVGVLLMGALRQARVVVIPLWAAHIGMSDSGASLVFGVATAIDMAMFIPAGYVMDRFGRVWTAVPSAIALAVGASLLPATSTPWQVGVVALLIGLGHGWGSGVVMTLGADAAPEQGKAVFLGAWSILQDAGGLLGPVIVAAGAAIALPLGFFAVGGVGAATVGVLHRFTPRWQLPHSSRA
ncbi:MFS transporter [Demequina sp. TTPB684]|uniref:MFS transporter n=1 Tax=unclassified Demequina TaxID=2620311 RepID=UPI001CF57EC6|nr:MFS transporter [Demequina sp. TMPB413]MCB2412798.1 MFS transporter [Demequina sp. TTPB684]UPU87435.1 MFS transporter [Demequina sp. TMPB413]